MSNWRIVDTDVNSGLFNMAIDEALLDEYIENPETPILRFYKWEKPTVSIGRNQAKEDINREELNNLEFDLVRRPTGGMAVLHQGEFTYSFISSKKFNIPESVFDAYLEISNALIKGLKFLAEEISFEIGNQKSSEYADKSFCFATATRADLSYMGYKVVGSSQLRRKDALLQHGSILVNQDFSLLKKVFVNPDPNVKGMNLKDIISFTPEYDFIKASIIRGFEEYFKVRFISDELTEKELLLANSYIDRYKP
jgi:lipoate-protein ligase A